MNYEKTVEYIHSLGMFSQKPSLERMMRVMSALGNPQNKFKCVHVAGTNGKGSVCTMMAAALIASGKRVGMFVSPYIVNFRERIQINGEYISENDLCRISEKVINTNIALTEFEFITAVGFLYFAENEIDIAVVETGLGGRLDATNVIPPPLASVITKIGLDHVAVLGDTVEKIAAEKCGIIKDNLVITTASQHSAALDVIKNAAAKKLVIANTDQVQTIKSDVHGSTFIYKGEQYTVSLAGGFQIENASMAIETLLRLGVDMTYIKAGLKSAFIPARNEVISKNPLVVLDGAHNPDGANALAEIMRNHSNITAVVGVMQDKNYKSVLQQTLPFCENVVCTTVPENPRSLSAKDLAAAARKYCKNVFVTENLDEAITLSRQKSGGNPIFIFGSLYLASAIHPLL